MTFDANKYPTKTKLEKRTSRISEKDFFIGKIIDNKDFTIAVNQKNSIMLFFCLIFLYWAF